MIIENFNYLFKKLANSTFISTLFPLEGWNIFALIYHHNLSISLKRNFFHSISCLQTIRSMCKEHFEEQNYCTLFANYEC